MINITHRKVTPELSKYIRKISVFKSKGKINFRQKLTPSTSTYLSYSQEDIPVFVSGHQKVLTSQRLQITGPKTNGKLYVEYQGNISQVLVEFTASGFNHLFHRSPSGLVNVSIEFSDYRNDKVTERFKRELGRAKNIKTAIEIMEGYLLELSLQALPPINYIEKALQIIEAHHGDISVSEVIKQVYICERQFNRKFKEVVGSSPKCYAKIIQLHYIINLMQRKEYDSIQTLAYRSGFYDISHFDHRFKELTGFTPIEFINSNDHIALKYFSSLKEDS